MIMDWPRAITDGDQLVTIWSRCTHLEETEEEGNSQEMHVSENADRTAIKNFPQMLNAGASPYAASLVFFLLLLAAFLFFVGGS